jgi:hypothetical protein
MARKNRDNSLRLRLAYCERVRDALCLNVEEELGMLDEDYLLALENLRDDVDGFMIAKREESKHDDAG